MSLNTTNSGAFINTEQYDSFILSQLQENMLPTVFYRDVTNFQSGSTLNIKSVGARTIQDVTEEQALVSTPIDSSTITLTINKWKGDKMHVTDKLREDGEQVEALLAESALQTSMALAEDFESNAYSVLNAGQTAADANSINGFAHRVVSAESNNVVSLQHFLEMKLAFDKAKVPAAGRIAVVDPIVEATLNDLVSADASINNNPLFEGIVKTGFMMDHRFVTTIHGWTIMTSNLLPAIASETIGAGSVTGGVANIFMSIASDNHKPLMSATRRKVRTEAWRDHDNERDVMQTTQRYGQGVQRKDTLGVVITSATNYK
jgi:hypothetical protein